MTRTPHGHRGKNYVRYSEPDEPKCDDGQVTLASLTQQLHQLQVTFENVKRSAAPTPADANPQFSGAFMARAEIFQEFDQKLPMTATHGDVAYDELNSNEGSSIVTKSRQTKKFVRPGFTPLGLVPSAYAS